MLSIKKIDNIYILTFSCDICKNLRESTHASEQEANQKADTVVDGGFICPCCG